MTPEEIGKKLLETLDEIRYGLNGYMIDRKIKLSEVADLMAAAGHVDLSAKGGRLDYRVERT